MGVMIIRNRRMATVAEMKRDTVLLNLDPRLDLNLSLKQLRQTLRILPRVEFAGKRPSSVLKYSLFGDSEEVLP